MIIWSGLGFLVVLIPLVISIFTIGYLGNSNLVFYLGFVVSAVLIWMIGRKMNNKPGREVVDKKTGEEIILKQNHSLFWIKMEYWGILIGILGIFLVLNDIVKS